MCVTVRSIHVIALVIYVLCHLQRFIDIGAQDGQKVINATDKKRTWERKEGLVKLYM